ncbi:MAG: septum formation initiator family protein [Candidatus Adiutrix sp.]|jgi:cell division protein FtsB|nr:septum formation initiator family protein [Candidatus Adiutrix sp.]
MRDFSGSHEDQPAAPDQPREKRRLLALLWLVPWLLLKSHGLIALGAALLGLFVYLAASDGGLMKHRELEAETKRLEAEIENLQDENMLLRQRLERLRTDPAYVEDEARKKLGLIRPGETVYRLSEEPDLMDDRPAEMPPLP